MNSKIAHVLPRVLTHSLVFLFVAVATCSAQETQPDGETTTKPETLQQQMLGAWVLAGKPGAEVEPKPGARMKFFGLGYWLITQHNPDNGNVIFHHGGTYVLDGDRYVETVVFANDNTKQAIGTDLIFSIKVEDGKYTQIGKGNPYTEVWVRPAVK